MGTTRVLCSASLTLCLLFVVLPSCFAQRPLGEWQWQLQGLNPFHTGRHQQGRLRHRQQQYREECDIWSLTAGEPFRRIESEAGVTEYWDPTQQQFRCAGVVVLRHVIEPKGLLLPTYANAPRITYVVQGRGLFGVTIPGCAETFQSEIRSERESRRIRDEHQRIRRFCEGDVLASPAGVTKWVYNDGDSKAIAITVFDTSNFQNQLDEELRLFRLAGSHQIEELRGERREGRRHFEEGRNIFSGFDQELLAEALGVNVETVDRLQGQNDQRGNIVLVEKSLEMLSPDYQEEEIIRREELEREERRRGRYNGLEETFCSLKLKHNINTPSETDIYNPRAGRITTLNSNKLPILNFLQLSAYRVILYKHALAAPFWNVNAHSIVYITRGRGRVQIVRDNGRLVLDQEVQEGQLFVVPQNFVVLKKASREGLEYVAFKTSDNAVVSHLAGRTSALRSLPVEVLANSYLISRESARQLKHARRSVAVLPPRGLSRREGEYERERAATISDN